MGVIADIAAAVSECGNLGYGHAGLARLHQLVCVLPHMVNMLSLHKIHPSRKSETVDTNESLPLCCCKAYVVPFSPSDTQVTTSHTVVQWLG